MKIKVDPGTIYTSLVLTIITTMVVYAILQASPPSVLLDANKKFKVCWAIGYSLIIGSIISIFMAIISLFVDRQVERQKKISSLV